MKSFVERQLVRLLLSRGGPLVQKAVTALAAAAVTYVSQKLGLDVAALGLTETVLTGILWAVIDIAVTKLPANILKDYGSQLQRMLNAYSQGTQLKVDGFVGPKTVAQAQAEIRSR